MSFELLIAAVSDQFLASGFQMLSLEFDISTSGEARAAAKVVKDKMAKVWS